MKRSYPSPHEDPHWGHYRFLKESLRVMGLVLISGLAVLPCLAQKGAKAKVPAAERTLREQELLRRNRSPKEMEKDLRKLQKAFPTGPFAQAILSKDRAPRRGLEAVANAIRGGDQPRSLKLGLGPSADSSGYTPDYVRWLQSSLNQITNAGLEVDGRLGPKTQDAIRAFQQRNGLKVDGIVGAETERRLFWDTGRMPPGLGPVALTRILAPSFVSRDAVYIDVSKEGEATRVVARVGAPGSAAPGRIPKGTGPDDRVISSVEELEALMAGSRRLIQRGEDLPPEWVERLKARGGRDIRISDRSPKTTIGEHVRAAELLDRWAEPGKTRIFSGLPQARGGNILQEELRRMNLPPEEAEGWRKLDERTQDIAKQSKIPIEVATKEALLDELRTGTHDNIVLVAHFAEGMLHLPGGETISTSELSRIERLEAPNRIIVLISCGTGTVNAPLASLAEILLERKVAANVIAPPEPVSALDVPGALQRFLLEGRTVGEVFNRNGYNSITHLPGTNPGVRRGLHLGGIVGPSAPEQTTFDTDVPFPGGFVQRPGWNVGVRQEKTQQKLRRWPGE